MKEEKKPDFNEVRKPEIVVVKITGLDGRLVERYRKYQWDTWLVLDTERLFGRNQNALRVLADVSRRAISKERTDFAAIAHRQDSE